MSEYTAKEVRKWSKEKHKALGKSDPAEAARICNILGDIFSKQGKFEEALKEHQEEEHYSRMIEDRLGVAVAHRKLGEVYSEMANYKNALEHHRTYYEMVKELKNNLEIQRAWTTNGRTYLYQAESLKDDSVQSSAALVHAQECFYRSLKACSKLKDVTSKSELIEMKSRSLLNLAIVKDHQGEPKEAIELLNQAIEMNEDGVLLDNLQRCHYNLACIYSRLKEFEKALEHAATAEQVAQKLKDKSLQCDILNIKADVFFHQGNYISARKQLRKAYAIKTPVPDDHMKIADKYKVAIRLCRLEDELNLVPETNYNQLIKIYEKFGDTCASIENYTHAINCYLLMLKNSELAGLSGKHLVPVYVSLSQTYKDNKQYDLSMIYSRMELSLYDNNPKEACKTKLNIASCMEVLEESLVELEEMYKSAMQLAREAEAPHLEIECLRFLKDVYIRQQKTEAIVSLTCEIEQLEDQISNMSLEEEIEGDSQSVGGSIDLDHLSDDSASNDEACDHNVTRTRRKRLEDKKNERGETALHIACINGNIKQVKSLIQRGHPVNVRDNCGWLPLHEACNHGFLNIVKELLDHGASINDRGGQDCQGITPLHDAASCGNLDIMECLIEHGASISAKTDIGENALDYLIQWKERTVNLDDATICEYTRIEKKLMDMLKRAGHSVSHVTEVTQDTNRRTSRCARRSSRTNSDIIEEHYVEWPVQRTRNSLSLCYDNNSPTSANVPTTTSVVATSGGRKRHSTEAHLISSDDDDDIHPAILNQNDETIDRSQNATTEYRNAMENLRHRTKETIPALEILDDGDTRSALLDARNYVGSDSWLDDDLGIGQSTKRRKTTNVFTTFSTRNNNNADMNRERRTNHTRVQSRIPKSYTVTPNQELEDDIETRHDLFPQQDQYHANSTSINSTRTRQTDLNNFVEIVTETEAVITNNEINSSPPVPSHTIPLAQNVLRIKVRIKDTVLLVPVLPHENKTFGWLNQESAKRYYNQMGLRPLLILETQDGAVLSDEDPVSLLLSNNEVIVGKVTSWDLPSLPTRYANACSQMGSSAFQDITSQLQICENSFKLNLSNCPIGTTHCKPLLRALQCQYTLRELTLSRIKLKNEGFKLLCSTLQTLTCLSKLNISCNKISANGLEDFATICQQQVLKHLISLDLSLNPLDNTCSQSLIVIIQSLSSLLCLNLQRCHFSALLFKNNEAVFQTTLYDSQLTDLDISINQWEEAGLHIVLQSLNPQRIHTLRIGSIGTLRNGSSLVQYWKRSDQCCLRELDLSDCSLTDTLVEEIIESIHLVVHLKCLILANNPQLTSVSLCVLLNKCVTVEKFDFLGCYRLFSSLIYTEFRGIFEERLSSEYPIKEIQFSITNQNKQLIQSICDSWENVYFTNAVIKKVGSTLKLSCSI